MPRDATAAAGVAADGSAHVGLKLARRLLKCGVGGDVKRVLDNLVEMIYVCCTSNELTLFQTNSKENLMYAVISVLPLNNMLWVYFANFRRWVFTSFGKMGTFDNENIDGSHDAVGWSKHGD